MIDIVSLFKNIFFANTVYDSLNYVIQTKIEFKQAKWFRLNENAFMAEIKATIDLPKTLG